MESPRSGRSLEDVAKAIAFAKLQQEDLLPACQAVSFAQGDLGAGDIRLLEVPPSLAASLEQGSVLTLRGEPGDPAVLCTDTDTFSVKEAETSNSVLLLPRLSLPGGGLPDQGDLSLTPCAVTGVFYKYLEVLPALPGLRRIPAILGERTYGEHSAREGQTGHTLAQLLDRVQASEAELLSGLRDCGAVRVEGDWFLLDQDYHMKLLSYIIRFFAENSWSLDGDVDRTETVAALQDLVPGQLCGQVFDIYCRPAGGSWRVDTAAVARFYGDFLLASGTGTAARYSRTEFLSTWAKAVPDGVRTDLSQLAGLVIVDDSKEPAQVRRFPESHLPEGIQERLVQLFAARERWTLEDISPFIAPLATNKLNVNALLTKHARPLNIGGMKYFCAKHGK